jgi:signal transduction histidine kinase
MRGRAPVIAAWIVAGIAVASLPVTFAVARAAPAPGADAVEGITSTLVATGAVALVVLASAIVGVLIVANQPRNGVGWLFVAESLILSAVAFTGTYAERGLAAEPAWPGAAYAAWASDVAYLPLFAGASVFLLLLYPEGTLELGFERRTAVIAVTAMGIGMAAAIVEPNLYAYPDLANPAGLGAPRALAYTLAGVGFAGVLGCTAASMIHVIRELRKARGREREQLRILVWAGVTGIALLLPSFVGADASAPVLVLGLIGILLIPISVGYAILRHRLFDIDLVIRRTVVFGVLAAFATAVYVVVVVAIPAILLGPEDVRAFDLLPFAAAAIVAIAFQPVRRRARRLAARIAYGERATPYEVMAELAGRMGDVYREEDLLPRVARALAEGTRAARADVWLRIGDDLRRSATWPPDGRLGDRLPLTGDGMPEVPGDLSVPVAHRDELLGALALTEPPGASVTETERRLLDDVASQASIALRNVRLTEELREKLVELTDSRRRLVSAQDEGRRRLERDIHDGAQQQLVALAVKARLADASIDADASKAHALLGEIQTETGEALEALRELARGIYPPLLADRGLVAALEAQARKSTVPVEVRAAEVGRYPRDVEATVYFCCLEAIQNAAKYADPTRVEIRLRREGPSLAFAVRDDGAGFDPATTPAGMGLQNMRDRLAAVGAALEVRSAPGRGTTLVAAIPATPLPAGADPGAG